MHVMARCGRQTHTAVAAVMPCCIYQAKASVQDASGQCVMLWHSVLSSMLLKRAVAENMRLCGDKDVGIG